MVVVHDGGKQARLRQAAKQVTTCDLQKYRHPTTRIAPLAHTAYVMCAGGSAAIVSGVSYHKCAYPDSRLRESVSKARLWLCFVRLP
jgi:hypothetical protein